MKKFEKQNKNIKTNDSLIEALNDPTNRFHEIKKMIEMTP